MFKLIARAALLLAGTALLLDILLPATAHTLTVSGHASSTASRTTNGSENRWADISYTLNFAGGEPASCAVGSAAYEALKDGDVVQVQATQLSGNCLRMARAGEVIALDTHWKLVALLGGCVLIACALGWRDAHGRGPSGP